MNEFKDYNIFFVEPDGKSFYFPYVLCVPNNLEASDTLFVETNNEEDVDKLESSARNTVSRLLNIMKGSVKKSPIFIPIVPTNGTNGRPYFQQLSHECFDEKILAEQRPDLPIEHQKRIDLQVKSAIEDAKQKIEKETGIKLSNKIFMHGYSASGVFAQRFALIHPEIIGGLCVGGAIGSIPMPLSHYKDKILNYPIGIGDYELLFEKQFDMDAYKQIKFSYYVAGKESETLSDKRVKDDGITPAPMHDMSYMERSMPKEMGRNLRELFGEDMFERGMAQLSKCIEMGFDVSARKFPHIKHAEIGNSAFKFIDDCKNDYLESDDRTM